MALPLIPNDFILIMIIRSLVSSRNLLSTSANARLLSSCSAVFFTCRERDGASGEPRPFLSGSFLTTEAWCVIRLLSALTLNTGLEFLQLQLELETGFNHGLVFWSVHSSSCSTMSHFLHGDKVCKSRC